MNKQRESSGATQSLPYRFPHLIAQPYRRLKVSPDVPARFKYMTEVAHMLAAYLGSLALVEYRCLNLDVDWVDEAVSRALSRGDWLAVLETLGPRLQGALFAPELWAGWSPNHLRDLSHLTAELVNQTDFVPLHSRLLDLLYAARHVQRCPLAYLSAHREDRLTGFHRYLLHGCMGSEDSFGYAPFQCQECLPTDELLVLSRESESCLIVHPLLRCGICPEDNVIRLFVLERMDRQLATWRAGACGHHLEASLDSDLGRLCRALVSPGDGPRLRRNRLRADVHTLSGWADSSAALDLTEGTVVDGRYRVLAPIRSGGSAGVFLCEHLDSGAVRALKVLRADLARDENNVLRFQRAAQLSESVRHPNLLGVHDCGFHLDRPFLVMDYMEAGDLWERLEIGGRMSLTDALPLFSQVLDGLGALHKAGIIHRDLKPSNLLFSGDSQVRIGDFGIAREIAAAGLTGSITVLGTWGYMAPEQRRGGLADTRSDLYSAGILLLVMLTGQVPAELEQLETLLGTLPHPVRAVIRRCVEVNPGGRYESVSALQKALNRLDSTEDADSRSDFQAWRGRLKERVRAWQSAGCDDTQLLDLAVLEPAQGWLSTHRDCLNQDEVALIQESERVARGSLGPRLSAWCWDTLPFLLGVWLLVAWDQGIILAMAALAGYHFWFESGGRVAPGKRRLGLRLRDRRGQAPNFPRRALRLLLANLPLILIPAYLGSARVVLMVARCISEPAHLWLEKGFLLSPFVGLVVVQFCAPIGLGVLNLLSFYARDARLTLHDRLTGTQVLRAV